MLGLNFGLALWCRPRKSGKALRITLLRRREALCARYQLRTLWGHSSAPCPTVDVRSAPSTCAEPQHCVFPFFRLQRGEGWAACDHVGRPVDVHRSRQLLVAPLVGVYHPAVALLCAQRARLSPFRCLASFCLMTGLAIRQALIPWMVLWVSLPWCLLFQDSGDGGERSRRGLETDYCGTQVGEDVRDDVYHEAFLHHHVFNLCAKVVGQALE